MFLLQLRHDFPTCDWSLLHLTLEEKPCNETGYSHNNDSCNRVSSQFGAFLFGARQFDACQFGALHFDAVPVRRVSV